MLQIPHYKVRKLRPVLDFPADEFGPEAVHEVFDPRKSAKQEKIGWLVVDNTWRSPTGTGKGGTAMYRGCDLAITLGKGRVMTWKQVLCVPIGEKPEYDPWGGIKGGIDFESGHPRQVTLIAKAVLRGWARALFEADLIKIGDTPGKYIFGLDVGLGEWAAREVVDELGDRRVSTGKPRDLGGIPYDEMGITGVASIEALIAMCEYAGVEFHSSKTTMAIQGFGAVGQGFMKGLKEFRVGERPTVTIIADPRFGGVIQCHFIAGGFEPVGTLDLISRNSDLRGYSFATGRLNPGEELFADVDILALASSEPRQIHEDNVGKIRARVILQGANLGVTESAERALWERGKIIVPGFVVNAGASGASYVEYAGGTPEEGLDYAKRVVGHNTRFVLEEAKRTVRDPRSIALEIAKREVWRARPPRHIERAILS